MEHRARKRFGQHFLHDPAVIARILAAVAPCPGQAIVEIGPGLGAITDGLLAGAGQLDVIEIDRDLAAHLAQRHAGNDALRIHQADALTFDLLALGAERGQPLRIVGNLPYNISTPLLFRLLDQRACLTDLHLLLQKEVVERIVAAPGSRTYGRLSVMAQTLCVGERLFTVGAGAFTPAPKVESALLRLHPWPTLPWELGDPAEHARLVATAFAQRRKTLRNSLKGLVGEATLRAAGIDPDRRAETLAPEDFARLSRLGCKTAAKPRD